jgi:putative ABC transport system permease protein
MVSALNLKLLRDLRHQRGQLVSIALLVGCGVMAFVGMRSTRESIRAAREEYYVRQRFAHVFATLERAPEYLANRIAAIRGVGVVETRVVLPATVEVPRLPELATAMLVSLPRHRQAMLNDVHLYRGRYIAPDRDDEVIASVKFATANSLRVGENLAVVVNGRWKRLRVVGIGSSPEYIYEMGPGGFIVDNRRFGILWMRREALAADGGMVGAFNDVSLLLWSRDREAEVIAALDAVLAPYGGIGAYGRARQTSAEVLDSEMRQLDAMALVFPVFFLGIAAFLLNVVLSRLIATQRGEIGTLKAFGYTDREVSIHYLGFAIMSVALGSVLGLIGAVWMGNWFTGIYADFFGFPTLVHRTQWSVSAVGIGVSGGAALFGALWAVRGAARLPPAEAMRPPAPARFSASLIERLRVGRTFSPGTLMVIRNLTGRPFRTIASMIGIGLASAILVAGIYPFDGIDRMIDVQFKQAQRENLSVTFVSPRGPRALHELDALPGVHRVEGVRSAAVRLRHLQHVRTAAIVGIDADATLRELVDMDGGRYALPGDGLVLTSALAKALEVRIGGLVDVQLLEVGRRTRPVRIVGVIEEPIGLGGYMERGALNRLLREGDVITGANLVVDPSAEQELYARLKRMPLVVAASSRRAMLDYFERTIAESILISAGIVIFAAGIIAIGVIYNNSRIAISERGRELASLRVLGFTRREVSGLFLGEQAAITLSGLPIGAVAGLGFAAILAAAFATERHRFPVIIEPSTYAYSIGVVLLVAAGVAFIVRRRLDRLDLIATLKTGD